MSYVQGEDRRRDKRLFPDATGAASAEGWCQCQGFACSHPSLLLVAVIRTASGTRATSICASLTRSNVAAVACKPSGPMSSTNANGSAAAGYRTYTGP